MASIAPRSPAWASEITSATPASLQRPQKRRPKRTVLGIEDLKAEDFTASVGCLPGGDDHGLGHTG
jgi:hypothetical protein